MRSNAARSAGSEAPPFERTVPFWLARFAVFVCFLLLFCSARLCPFVRRQTSEAHDTNHYAAMGNDPIGATGGVEGACGDTRTIHRAGSIARAQSAKLGI
ncbi:hypothetical protein [Acetobacter papayae]|uniref:hypothetical protein n=1 Tax=Acetobacter papayae TaxID=1076592 RepID=UPI00131F3CB0